MRRPGIASLLVVAPALVLGLLVAPASGASRAAGDTSLTITPAHPVHGTKTKLKVTGYAKGGRFLMPIRITYGDGSGQGVAIDCIANPPKHHLHHDRYAIHTSHVWRKAGTYTVRMTLAAPCTRPRVTSRHVRVDIVVS